MTTQETKERIETFVKNDAQLATIFHHMAFSYFCKEMCDKNYGPEETFDAWTFYEAGWQACLLCGARC